MAPERHKRLTKLDFFEDDLDYGDVQATGYLWRDLYKRRQQEAWLDSLSDPPDESVLYGETLVVDGVLVGEWKHADKTEPDELPVGFTHHAGVRPLTDEEREALIIEQRKPPPPPPPPRELSEREQKELSEEEQEEQIRAELRAMPLPPSLAERWREYHDEEYDDAAEGRRLKQRIEEDRRRHEQWRRENQQRANEAEKARYEKHREYEKQRKAERHREAEQFKTMVSRVAFPPPQPQPPKLIRLTDAHGIEHIIPPEVYERFGREAILLPGVDPAVWVLYRLGFGWNE